MSIGSRIFLSCLCVVCLCLYYPLRNVADTVVTHYREGVEDVLVDQANILASLVEEEIRRERFSPDDWGRLFDVVHERSLKARIYELHKERVDMEIYITDKQGIVLFDSGSPENIGRDFSLWRDVLLTLQGSYGARTTHSVNTPQPASVLHVAAPIRVDGEIAGVLTVAKPTTNIIYFVEGARRNIVRSGLVSLAAAGILSLLVTVWLTRPIKRLTRYARGIRDGENPRFPRLGGGEVGELGNALAEMQETLEGKRYVEQYVQHLTHELKSPLSAIRGAAELLSEPMEDSRRQRFITNISEQSVRIQEIADRMLELAALESRSYKHTREALDAGALLSEVLHGKELLAAARGIHVEASSLEGIVVQGDGFLLQQALLNLVQNAMDFSPEGGVIRVSLEQEGGRAVFRVRDQGPGIPEYAVARVFEKFFSLQRPGSGKKSTGLGLNFVRQVALLHGGMVGLLNHPEGGAEAFLDLPVR